MSATSSQSRGAFAAAATVHARFHAILIERTPNPLIRQLCRSMLDVVRDSQYAISRTDGAGEYSVGQHRLILEALRSGDLDAVASRIVDHLVPEFRYPASEEA